MDDITTLRWPGERDERDRLERLGRARLLVVEAESTPPITADPLEEWVRVGDSELDVSARLEGLRRRLRRSGDLVPELDHDGVIRFGSRWAPLPPLEARLAGALVGRFRTVVTRDALLAAGWPDRVPGRNTLDVHVLRVRRRLAPLSLTIRTVRSRGYLLESSLAPSSKADALHGSID